MSTRTTAKTPTSREVLKTLPVAFLRLSSEQSTAIQESRNGLNRFTLAKPHSFLEKLKFPSLALVEMEVDGECECYAGLLQSKAPITTLESRIELVRLAKLSVLRLDELSTRVTPKRMSGLLRAKLADLAKEPALSDKLGVTVVDELLKNHADAAALERAASGIAAKRKPNPVVWAQSDAIKTALSVFRLGPKDIADSVVIKKGAVSSLSEVGASVLEDNVIAKDASWIPGFGLIKKQVTGKAVFSTGTEHLEVYTANKGPLEEMLGVDLIYVNESMGAIVMVQYKMLEPVGDDWQFRRDAQLDKEIARMKIPPTKTAADGYRLHASPFFFKFVRRKGDGDKHSSFIMTLEHLNRILASPAGKGAKGGVRLSYEGLKGAYLREADLLGLIRSGYIGTHQVETDALKPIIESVSKGDRALVLAWQKTVHEPSHSDSDDFESDPE